MDMFEKRQKHTPNDTWRKLKELEPIQRWQCRIGWHQWTNWELWEQAYAAGQVSQATCYCSKCGMPRTENPITKRKK
jgi:hypothetical protein